MLCKSCGASINADAAFCPKCGHTFRAQSAPYTQPNYAQPGYGQPNYTQPGYNQPNYNQPGYGQPNYAQPGYNQPNYNQPGYGQPNYAQPGYNQPNYGQPGYGQPNYAQPGYGQPNYAQPGFGSTTPTTATNNLNGQDKTTMALVCFFLGVFGVHNFMMHETGRGIRKILFTLLCGFGAFLALCDFINILTNNYIAQPD